MKSAEPRSDASWPKNNPDSAGLTQASRKDTIKRNTIYSEEHKVILFVTTDHLIEMLAIKERGEDPSDLIMDMVERFYMQHE